MAARNYHAFIKEARASRGLSLQEARATYRAMKESLGRAPIGKDVNRHPRIFAREAKAASKEIARQEGLAAARKTAVAKDAVREARNARRREQYAEKKAAKEKTEKRPPAGAAAAAEKGKPFKSLMQYLDWYAEYEEPMDWWEVDGTVDY